MANPKPNYCAVATESHILAVRTTPKPWANVVPLSAIEDVEELDKPPGPGMWVWHDMGTEVDTVGEHPSDNPAIWRGCWLRLTPQQAAACASGVPPWNALVEDAELELVRMGEDLERAYEAVEKLSTEAWVASSRLVEMQTELDGWHRQLAAMGMPESSTPQDVSKALGELCQALGLERSATLVEAVRAAEDTMASWHAVQRERAKLCETVGIANGAGAAELLAAVEWLQAKLAAKPSRQAEPAPSGPRGYSTVRAIVAAGLPDTLSAAEAITQLYGALEWSKRERAEEIRATDAAVAAASEARKLLGGYRERVALERAAALEGTLVADNEFELKRVLAMLSRIDGEVLGG